ncbi:MAG: YHS domain-containing protein [Fimbriimonadaceae bacterium]|nr:YHS domain-containing protein [Fimbriimonadaceae bacterium]
MFRTFAATLTALAVVFLIGCAPEPEAAASGENANAVKSTGAATGDAKLQAAAWPTDIEISKDAEGNVVCPVMGTKVESPEKAVGYQDYEGKRYYFCCDGCPGAFKKDPAKYVKK